MSLAKDVWEVVKAPVYTALVVGLTTVIFPSSDYSAKLCQAQQAAILQRTQGSFASKVQSNRCSTEQDQLQMKADFNCVIGSGLGYRTQACEIKYKNQNR